MTETNVTLQAVAPDTASIEVPLMYLQNLPDGAIYQKKKGRLQIALKKNGDRIEATANTDSLLRELKLNKLTICSLEQYIKNRRLDAKDSTNNITKKESSGIPPAVGWTGVAAIVVITMILSFYFKKGD